MNRISVEFKTLFVVLACIGLAGCSTLKSNADKPIVSQAEPNQSEMAAEVSPVNGETVAAQPTPSSTMTELQQLIQTKGVNELRTSYNGNYGASLLFKRDTLTYYVALFQRQNFWRVVKTQDHVQAERQYKQFVDETNKLAEVDLKRIRLEADYAHTAQQLNQRTDELSTLRNDLEVQRQQQALVTAQQAQAKREAEQLAEQEKQARDQLRALQDQIKALEAQREALGANSSQGSKR
ncbi:DUF2968 domain-containing protein [Allopusillimonas ginsengisoli]|uniref:DUF2968 domain-containing protein n=1 Tax=Allopusillimonas ginsengisoli TaxID=453575 RepID=UPI00101EC511|nr:DUF2968 domain-containing protein [Allopusillimonas ginsengisoli]TEA80200.1 DUF2968 domain-containing protein [Allopusillimonas ginsengisoli]